jgi:2-dehydro-3-deoxyphosphooctonate aldolase (KDO 8-P synthase)
LLTERGTTFGHGDLVVDYRGLVLMREMGVPVVFDATHSTQRPSAIDGVSGGSRHLAAPLARAAVAVGVDAVFCEVHDDPDKALSDAASQIDLKQFERMVRDLKAIDALTHSETNP